jgi:hypothetical protein
MKSTIATTGMIAEARIAAPGEDLTVDLGANPTEGRIVNLAAGVDKKRRHTVVSPGIFSNNRRDSSLRNFITT